MSILTRLAAIKSLLMALHELDSIPRDDYDVAKSVAWACDDIRDVLEFLCPDREALDKIIESMRVAA